MLQKINKENTLDIFNMDFGKLAAEVKSIDDKYNGPKEKPAVTANRQTSGSMYSHKNQHRIDFSDIPAPEKKSEAKFAPPAQAKMSQSFDPQNRLHTDKMVSRTSSNSGGVTDFGGPNKYLKSESSPSIWDSEKLSRMANQIDSRDRIQQEKKAQQEERKTIRQESLDKLSEALQSVDQRKAASIAPAGDQVPQESARFSKGKNYISIFDCLAGKGDFNNLSEKTDGEKVSAQKREAKNQVDNSWKSGGKIKTTKDIADKLFNIFNKE